MPGSTPLSPRLSRAAAALLVALGVVLAPAAAGAKNVIVGSPLAGEFRPEACDSPSCTLTNTSFSTPGALATSPVDGAVVRWHMLLGSPGTGYRIRVLAPAGGSSYKGMGSSETQTPSGPELQSFPASLPIRVGQAIGLDIDDAVGTIGLAESAGLASFLKWAPTLSDGVSGEGGGNDNVELAFNAEIQPAPTVSGISPEAGSFKGGEQVTITGTDLTAASSVSFGTTEAQSFTVESESRISAVLPALAAKSISPVLVRTPAGTGSAPVAFEATACLVPKLAGKGLRAAKRRLRRAGCAVGRVRGRRSPGARIVKQRPKPGRALASGARVALTAR